MAAGFLWIVTATALVVAISYIATRLQTKLRLAIPGLMCTFLMVSYALYYPDSNRIADIAQLVAVFVTIILVLGDARKK